MISGMKKDLLHLDYMKFSNEKVHVVIAPKDLFKQEFKFDYLGKEYDLKSRLPELLIDARFPMKV